MRLVAPLIALLALAPSATEAACVAQSAATRPHLVELYTAEGCSSCPPAEKWLSSLRESTSYVALEFHVDYWDSQGWRDPYADARYTARQQALAKRGSRNIVYTPQIAVDGRVWKDWPKGAPPAAVDISAPALSLEVQPGDAVRVKVGTAPDAKTPDSWRLFVALSENGLTSAVNAGENKGKQLDHDHVVRDLEGPFELPNAEAVLKRPAASESSKSAVVAFVQDTANGDIVQALRLPLAECKP